MIKDLFSDVFNRIKNSIEKKHLYVFIYYNKQIIKMLKFLTLEGYIQHYCYYNINNNRTKRFIKIFLSYSGQWIKYPAINFLKKEKKSNFNNFLSKNKIEKFFLKNKKQGHNILTTTSGIINSKEAFLINKGGKFLYSIN